MAAAASAAVGSAVPAITASIQALRDRLARSKSGNKLEGAEVCFVLECVEYGICAFDIAVCISQLLVCGLVCWQLLGNGGV